MRKWLPFLGAGALILIAVALTWHRGTPIAASPHPSDGPQAVSLRWQEGTAQRYALRMDSSMQAGGATASRPTHVRMHATLNMLTLDRAADGARVGMQLEAVQLRVNGQRDADSEAALGAPFRVRFSWQGAPLAFEFAADVERQHRAMLENVVRTFQVTNRDGEQTWEVPEQGTSGAYVASYRRIAPLQIAKSKGRFDAPTTGMLAGAALASQELIRLDPHHDWLVSMTVDETLRSSGQDPMALTITNRATLELLPEARVALARAAWSFASADAPPRRPASRPVPGLSVTQARNEILARIKVLDANRQQRAQHIRRLSDLARIDPQLPEVIVEQLRTGTLNDSTRAELFLVLEMAGTASPQAALAAIMQDASWSVADQSRAVVALGGVHAPGTPAIDALWGLVAQAPAGGDAAKLAGDATFALGSAADSLRQAASPDYPALRQRLLSGARTGGGSRAEDQQRANHVLAIGNTRDAALTDDVADMLADASPLVRRAAAQALGALATDAAAQRMMVQFRAEPSGQVRGAIAESLQHWKAPTAQAMQTLRAAVAQESDERARHGIAVLLGSHVAQHPENAAALRQLLRTEPSRRIRQAAADALAQAGRS